MNTLEELNEAIDRVVSGHSACVLSGEFEVEFATFSAFVEEEASFGSDCFVLAFDDGESEGEYWVAIPHDLFLLERLKPTEAPEEILRNFESGNFDLPNDLAWVKARSKSDVYFIAGFVEGDLRRFDWDK